jgi:hypothetical protein
MTRSLRLRRETLTELSTDELLAVRGGDYTVGDHCGPPFDTKFLTPITAISNTLLTGSWSCG